MFLKITFPDDHTITIRLFQDHAVYFKWFDHFKKLNQRYYLEKDNTKTESSMLTDDEISESWNIIKTSLNKIQDLGLRFDVPISENFTGDQKILNRLHRFFTHNEFFGRNHYWGDKSLINRYDSSFKFPTNITYKHWFHLISPINDAVHFLEWSTRTENKDYVLESHRLDGFNFSPSNRYFDMKQWINFDENDLEGNYRYQNYLEYDGGLALLDQSITGKSVLRSFYDEDDPSEFDCTGRLGSSGGFIIDAGRDRQKIYNSERFKSWCRDHNKNIEELPLEFPIGTVTHSSNDLSKILNDNLFAEVKIEFLDKI